MFQINTWKDFLIVVGVLTAAGLLQALLFKQLLK